MPSTIVDYEINIFSTVIRVFSLPNASSLKHYYLHIL